MILGYETWRILKRHPQIQSLISNNLNKIVTIDFLKEIFEIPNIYVGKAVFTDENGNFSKVWADNIYFLILLILLQEPSMIRLLPIP